MTQADISGCSKLQLTAADGLFHSLSLKQRALMLADDLIALFFLA